MNGPWQITRQTTTVAMDPLTREYGPMIDVRFVTDQGDTGSVLVREDQFDVDKVRATINDKVAAMNELRGINT